MSSNTTNLQLYKANPVANPTDAFNIDTILNANWDKIDNKSIAVDNEIATINNEISSGATITPTISYGMNSKITNTSKNTISPKLTIQGKTIINPLGKDGNCEDVSKWTADNSSTLALDTTNKVFGSNGMKITLANTTGGMKNLISKYNLDVTKYYFISAYIKNGNATNVYIKKDATGGGNSVSSSLITLTSGFTRVGIIVQPSDLNSGNYIGIYSNGASTQYIYTDGIMVNEITSAEYALGATTLLANYPYVDSYSCLENPYVEVRHDNLVRNGNGEEGIGWWAPYNSNVTLNVVSSKLQVASTSGSLGVYQIVNVKPNTNYYLKGNTTAGTTTGIVQVWTIGFTSIISVIGTFNSGINSQVIVYLNDTGTGASSFDSIMLVEGTTAPPSYLPCRLERTVIEGQFTSDDSITYDNGEVTGSIWWKHKVLYGKDYDWQFYSDHTGYKRLNALIAMPNNSVQSQSGQLLTKYDGKIIQYYEASPTVSDQAFMQLTSGNSYLSVADTDTGWAESINPNADEVKAFMNGWKAIYNNGTRYQMWVSVLDGLSLPQGAVTAVASATSNTTTINVASGGTNFVSGDNILVTSVTGGVRSLGIVTGTPTATVITFTTSVNVVSTDILVKADIPATSTPLLTWCKNNVAPSYEGYQLHYKLANPEPITDDNCHIHGDIPLFDVGDNYLYLDSGIILGEVANAYNDGTYYWNNVLQSQSKYKQERTLYTYKNGIYDTKAVIGLRNDSYINNLGYGYTQWLIANFDTNATYTVDYKILATQAPQIGLIGCSYSQDIVTAINKLEEVTNNKQNHDSILDTLVDLSLYEKNKRPSLCNFLPWFSINGSVYLDFVFNFSVPKKAIPRITYANVLVYKGQSSAPIDITTKLTLNAIMVSTTNVYIRFVTTDATTVADIKTYGVQGLIDIIADCKGVI